MWVMLNAFCLELLKDGVILLVDFDSKMQDLGAIAAGLNVLNVVYLLNSIISQDNYHWPWKTLYEWKIGI